MNDATTTAHRIAHTALHVWFGGVTESKLRLFSRVFAFTFLVYVGGWSLFAREWLTDVGYHVSAATISAHYPKPWPLVPSMLLPVFLIAMLAVLVHEIVRPLRWFGTPLVLALAVYLQLVDQTSAFTINKLYVVGNAILVLSFFSTRVSNDDQRGPPLMSAWPLRTLQATLLIQYFTAGTCKVFFGDWLKHSDVLFTHVVGVYRTDFAGFVVTSFPRAIWPLFGAGALLFELAAPLLFLVKRLRVAGALMGVAFHLTVALFMKDLVYFSLQMVAFYILFVDDEWAARCEARLPFGAREKTDVG